MDISGLTREQKIDLLSALKKTEIVQKERSLDSFVPNKIQDNFHQSPKKIRAIIGGNALGKTTALVRELAETHTHHHKFRDTRTIFHTWVIVPSYDKIDDYLRILKDLCPPSKFPELDKMGTAFPRKLRWSDGGTTLFLSHDQDPAKFEGTSFDALFIDEPCPRNQFISAFRGLRRNPNYFIVLALTPISEPWIFEDIYEPWFLKKDQNIDCFMGSIYDNEKNLPPGFIEEFSARLTEDERKTRLYGEFQHLHGRIFKEFSRFSHVFDWKPWPEDWPVFACIDPHPRKPHTVVWIGCDPENNLVVLDELSVEGDLESLAFGIKEVEKRNKFKVIWRKMDNSGSASDWNRNTVCSDLRKHSVRAVAVKSHEKDVLGSIQKIKRLLRGDTIAGKQIPHLRFLNNCKLMIRDMEMYAWADYRNPERNGVNEKPRKIYDDFIDNLRYIVMSQPQFSRTSEVISYLPNETSAPYSRAPLKSKLQKPLKDSYFYGKKR